jgi:hypothetical protein
LAEEAARVHPRDYADWNMDGRPRVDQLVAELSPHCGREHHETADVVLTAREPNQRRAEGDF